MERITHILIFVLFSFWAQAQNTSSLLIKARVVDGKIYLRWGTDDPQLTKQGQNEGFLITRIASKGKNQSVKTFEFKMEDPSLWQTEGNEQVEIVKNAYATLNGDNTELNIVDQLNIQNNVYALTLFMSDISEHAARFTATGFVDTDVEEDTEYLYTIGIPNNREAGVSTVSISLNDAFELPKLTEVKTRDENLKANLSWIYKDFLETYSSYRIVKSSDGGNTYLPVSSAPFLPLVNQELEEPEYLANYKDELEENNKPYYYKVAGIDYFGQVSDFSEPIEVIGRPPPLQVYGQFDRIFENARGDWEITWYLRDVWEDKVKGFYVLRSLDGKETYEKVSDLLAPSQRSFVNNSPEDITFYKIVTVDENDYELESSAGFAQKNDNTPPAAPLWGEGYIDSLGHVYLDWKENPERDLGGYHVFFGNSPDAEFSKLTNGGELEVNTYVDTIKVDVIADHIYYKLQAIDFRGNQSEFSEIIKLKRPDVIPPRPPVFKRVVQEIDKNQINYTSSSSYDAVVSYLLRSKDQITWDIIDSTEAKGATIQFFDSTAICTEEYFYSLKSVDDDGLESRGDTISLSCIDSGKRPMITDFTVDYDAESKEVKLDWDYDFYTDVKSVMIYRASGDGKLTKHKQLWKKDINAVSMRSYGDEEVKTGEEYSYRVILRFTDNGFTKTRESDVIKLPKG